MKVKNSLFLPLIREKDGEYFLLKYIYNKKHAFTWNLYLSGFGGSRSNLSSATIRKPSLLMSKKLVVNSNVYFGIGSPGPWKLKKKI